VIRGLYSAAAGMIANFTRQETISNNLANLNTTGFKQDLIAIRQAAEVPEARQLSGLFEVPYPTRPGPTPLGVVGTGVVTDPVAVDQTQGDVRETGNELDLALVGPGYFQMQTPEGQTFYTRDGRFSRDGVGRLVDAKGNFLMGDDGPIRVAQGSVQIDPDGTVLSDGEEVDQIRVMSFQPDTPLKKIGASGFVPVDPSAPPTFVDPNTVVQQGAIEASNVDPNKAVVEMMSAARSYEAAQRMVQLNDSVLERAVNDLGRV
jgi:flagellar basal-body rod protein FlgG